MTMGGIRDFIRKRAALLKLALGATEAEVDPRWLTYDLWVKRYDTSGASDIAAYQALWAQRGDRFEFLSLILELPSDERLLPLVQTLESQIHTEWELCVCFASRPSVDFEEAAEKLGAKLKVAEGAPTRAARLNTAAAMAAGQLVMLPGAEVMLPVHALLVLGRQSFSEHGVIYTDEDSIDAAGRRFDPKFKPDWNPELATQMNYMGSLIAFSRDAFGLLGGFREGVEGAEEWDLALRLAAQASKILHIPLILAHTLPRVDVVAPGASKAIGDYVAGSGASATVDVLSSGLLKPVYALPDAKPLVSIIIPTKDQVGTLKTCLKSIEEKTDYDNRECIIVDNGSVEPGTTAFLTELERRGDATVLKCEEAFNYSRINNLAAQRAQGEVFAFLNNDLEVISRGWLSEMVSILMRPEVGAVGPALWYPDDTLQHGGVVLGIAKLAGHALKGLKRGERGYLDRAVTRQNVSAVTGACLVTKKELFNELGGFDAQLAVAYNDVDYCLRLRKAGYQVIWTPYAELYHHESLSRGSDLTGEQAQRLEREAELMRRKWGDTLKVDPYYNPNLTIHREDYSLAFPPRFDIRAAIIGTPL